MRSIISIPIASLASTCVLCHAAPSFASDATSPPSNRLLAMAAVVAIILLVLGLGLYFKVASLRPLVLRAGIEAQAREEREENARQEVAKASADLYAALTDLQGQIQFMRMARSLAEVVARSTERKASDPAPCTEPDLVPPRDTFTMLPPAMSSAPPSDAAGPDTIGDDDPTSVLSREALQHLRAGESQAPQGPD